MLCIVKYMRRNNMFRLIYEGILLDESLISLVYFLFIKNIRDKFSNIQKTYIIFIAPLRL